MLDTTELKFDGDDYVQIPSNSAYNFGSNQDFTIECRVRTNTTGDDVIIGDKDWVSGYNDGFVFSSSGLFTLKNNLNFHTISIVLKLKGTKTYSRRSFRND